jgi:hypothetical protein
MHLSLLLLYLTARELSSEAETLGGDYKGDQQHSWSLAVQAQTDCSAYPRGMPCTTQGAMPKPKNQKPPAPSPQSDREPQDHQNENSHAQGEAGATRNAFRRQARGAPQQSKTASQWDARGPGRPTRAAGGRGKQRQRPALRR